MERMDEAERLKLVQAYSDYIETQIVLQRVLSGSHADGFRVTADLWARHPYGAEAVNVKRYREASYKKDVAQTALFLAFGRPGIDFPIYFLVKHVHKDTTCKGLKHNSLNRTPETVIVAAAGMTPEQLIETYRENVCTHCFPDAPVEEMRAEAKRRKAEEIAADKAARAAKKAEKGITMPDGSPLRNKWGIIATAVTAEREAVDAWAQVKLWDDRYSDHDNYAHVRAEYSTYLADATQALAHKFGKTEDEVSAEIAAKGLKKFNRDYGKGF